MWPSASATCSAVRSWCSASSSSLRSADANTRRARCIAYDPPALVPIRATSAVRAIRVVDVSGVAPPPSRRPFSPAFFTARYVAAAAPNAAITAAATVFLDGTPSRLRGDVWASSHRNDEKTPRRSHRSGGGGAGGTGITNEIGHLAPPFGEVQIREAHDSEAEGCGLVVAPTVGVEIGHACMPSTTVGLEHEPPIRN